MGWASNWQGTRSLGMIVLAVWLILTGLLPLVGVKASATVILVLNILAVAAGLLILLRR